MPNEINHNKCRKREKDCVLKNRRRRKEERMKEGKRMEREGGENKIRKINKLQDGIARSKNVNLRPLHKRKRERKKKKKKRKKRIQNSNILVSLFFSFLVFCQLFIYSFFFCLFCLVFSFVLIRIQQLYF